MTRAMGDVHPLGNPHYWMDPENGKRIAKEIADKLTELRAGDAAFFQQQLASFTTRHDAAEQLWSAGSGFLYFCLSRLSFLYFPFAQ